MGMQIKDARNLAKQDIEYKAKLIQSIKSAEEALKDLKKNLTTSTSSKGKDSKGSNKSDVALSQSINKLCNILSNSLIGLLKKIETGSKSLNTGLTNTTKAQNDLIKNIASKNNKIESKVGQIGLPPSSVEIIGKATAVGVSKTIQKSNKDKAKLEKSNAFTATLSKSKEAKNITQSKESKKKEGKPLKIDSDKLLKGLHGILKGLLNPIALVTAFISAFLPYILIFGAMLYGAWSVLTDSAKETILNMAKEMGIHILVAVGTWKLMPTIFKGIIRGVELAYNAIRIRNENIYHARRMADLNRKAVLDTTVHKAEMFNAATEKKRGLIRFLWDKAFNILRTIYEGIKLAASLAASAFIYVAIGAAIVLLIAGIIYIIRKYWETIFKVISGVFNWVKEQFSWAFGKIKSLISKIFDGVGKLFGKIFGFGDKNEAVKKKEENANGISSENTTKLDQQSTIDAFSIALEPVIEPLKIISEEIGRLNKFLIGDSSTPNNTQYSQLNSFSQTNKDLRIANNDSTHTSISTILTEVNSKSYESLEEKMDSLISIMQTMGKKLEMIANNQINIANNMPLQRIVG